MFIPPFTSPGKRSGQAYSHNAQPQFSGFDKKGEFYKVADELDTALLEAEDSIETAGRTDREIEIAAEKARQAFNTKPYELKFITALAQDVADHFKSWNDPIPKIPAAKMVKNAIAWIVAYKQDDGFDIREYKPPTRSNKGGYIYRELLDSKQETIPWPADESEDQKAGWPISKTPAQDLQNTFNTMLGQLVPRFQYQTSSRGIASEVEAVPEQTPPRTKNKTLPKKAAASASVAREKQPKTPSTARQPEHRKTANASEPTEQEQPAPLSFSKVVHTFSTEPYIPKEINTTGIQTEPEKPAPLSLSKVVHTVATEPFVPVKTISTEVQTEPEKPAPLSLTEVLHTFETEPYVPVETISTGTQVNMGPRKFTLSPAIDPTSPHITIAEGMAPDGRVEDILDWEVENAFSAADLRTLTESKPGTKKLYQWFSSEYRGTHPDHKAIAFSRFVRDLRDPAEPVNEENLFSYLEAEGPASPEPSSQTQDNSTRKRKASDSSLRSN